MPDRLTLTDIHGAIDGIQANLYDFFIASRADEFYKRIPGVLKDLLDHHRILDIGCGPGHASLSIAHHYPQSQIIGIDLAPTMIQIAEKRRKKSKMKNISFQIGDAMNLSFPDASFDTVVSFASIKHWPDPHQGIREIHRVLVPGGTGVVVEADRGASYQSIQKLLQLGVLKPFGKKLPQMFFRVYVLGHSYDFCDLLEMMKVSPFKDYEVSRLEEGPFLSIRMQK